MDILKEPVGKQDQYIAAFGGITCFRFLPNGQVEAWPLKISQRHALRPGRSPAACSSPVTPARPARSSRSRTPRARSNDSSMIANLHFVKQLGRDIKDALEAGDLQRFGELMNTHWEHKKKRSAAMSNERINDWYDLAMQNGALGGKLIGAGGGGFLMFCARSGASAAGRWPRRGWKRSGSGSTSKGPR